MQRERKVEAVAAQHQKSLEALEEAGDIDSQTEDEECQRGRGIGRTQRETTQEAAGIKQEADATVDNRVAAGVAQARREARKRRERP